MAGLTINGGQPITDFMKSQPSLAFDPNAKFVYRIIPGAQGRQPNERNTPSIELDEGQRVNMDGNSPIDINLTERPPSYKTLQEIDDFRGRCTDAASMSTWSQRKVEAFLRAVKNPGPIPPDDAKLLFGENYKYDPNNPPKGLGLGSKVKITRGGAYQDSELINLKKGVSQNKGREGMLGIGDVSRPKHVVAIPGPVTIDTTGAVKPLGGIAVYDPHNYTTEFYPYGDAGAADTTKYVDEKGRNISGYRYDWWDPKPNIDTCTTRFNPATGRYEPNGYFKDKTPGGSLTGSKDLSLKGPHISAGVGAMFSAYMFYESIGALSEKIAHGNIAVQAFSGLAVGWMATDVGLTGLYAWNEVQRATSSGTKGWINPGESSRVITFPGSKHLPRMTFNSRTAGWGLGLFSAATGLIFTTISLCEGEFKNALYNLGGTIGGYSAAVGCAKFSSMSITKNMKGIYGILADTGITMGCALGGAHAIGSLFASVYGDDAVSDRHAQAWQKDPRNADPATSFSNMLKTAALHSVTIFEKATPLSQNQIGQMAFFSASFGRAVEVTYQRLQHMIQSKPESQRTEADKRAIFKTQEMLMGMLNAQMGIHKIISADMTLRVQNEVRDFTIRVDNIEKKFNAGALTEVPDLKAALVELKAAKELAKDHLELLNEQRKKMPAGMPKEARDEFNTVVASVEAWGKKVDGLIAKSQREIDKPWRNANYSPAQPTEPMGLLSSPPVVFATQPNQPTTSKSAGSNPLPR